MKLRILWLSLLLPASAMAQTQAQDAITIQIIPRYTYATARYDLNTTSTASYSGSAIGGEVVQRFDGKRYGFALVGGLNSLSLDNEANVATQQESMKGIVANVGARLYAANMYVGLGLLYNSLEASYKAGATETTTKHSGIGFRVETGFDLPLGQLFVLAPNIHYDVSQLSPDTAGSVTRRFKKFGASIGLGVGF